MEDKKITVTQNLSTRLDEIERREIELLSQG